MESLLEFLEPLTRLISTIVVIVLFFLCIVRPLLNYLFVSYDIERRKECIAESMAAASADELEGSPVGEERQGDESVTFGNARASEKDTISRLAASDPAKASEMVKKWVHSD